MARRTKKKPPTETQTYTHKSAKRTNIPPAKIAGEGETPKVGKQEYAYSPHLDPTLRFDSTGKSDVVEELLEKAESEALTAEEIELLRRATAQSQPWLEWAGKQEENDRGGFEVNPVALHIHERISSDAILSSAKRKDLERSLFADPELEYREAVQFYRHEMGWANRLILGDSLQVMSSLASREDLAGRVQMIYIDPPYGIKFGSNFQPVTGQTSVKDAGSDLTRELVMVRAYRDTWRLGVHSYLSYLRDRIIAAHLLLRESGSIFIQIGVENVHRVHSLLDEVFGPENFCSLISLKKTSGLGAKLLQNTQDYILWYARDKDRLKFNKLFVDKTEEVQSDPHWQIDGNGDFFTPDNLTGQHTNTKSCLFTAEFEGKKYSLPATRQWKTHAVGMQRLIKAGRVMRSGNSLRYIRYLNDGKMREIADTWHDIGASVQSRNDPKVYVVQTGVAAIQRCLLMATDPGDLVLDPTCGAGTTAVTAERWGRRWIMIDTSRVAITAARQRIVTRSFPYYSLLGDDPSAGFNLKKEPKITLRDFSTNDQVDQVSADHEVFIDKQLACVSHAMEKVDNELRTRLVEKLAHLMQEGGASSLSPRDRLRWLLPGTTEMQIESAFAGKSKLTARHAKDYAAMVPPSGGLEHWHVPYDTDSDWPTALIEAVTEYRHAWQAKLDAINACISARHGQDVLVDKPEIVENVLRVSGPFTVEGVMPLEFSMDGGDASGGCDADLGGDAGDPQNMAGYLKQMADHLEGDGITFSNNTNRKFSRLERLFEDGSGMVHAEGAWEEEDDDGSCPVGITFGPQVGPVTAIQVEEFMREAARRGYDELVIAGFDFDATAVAVIEEASHPKLKAVHMAHIRPDINPGMEGLLKDTPNSQLFTVFGMPEIEMERTDAGEFAVTLKGVDIYNPVKGEIQSTGSTKVAAWFLDSDYDGRCFCITQAFFPDQDAWGKLAKALKDVVDADAFAAFKGTVSLPFKAGEHKRIAVKVIDPRGSEVMTVRKLEDIGQ